MEKTVCEKDWGAPDPISGEAIARVSNLLSSGRLHSSYFEHAIVKAGFPVSCAVLAFLVSLENVTVRF